MFGAALMRIADPGNFPSFGLAIWWALQTITTVGYGDVVPTSVGGRVLGDSITWGASVLSATGLWLEQGVSP